MTCCRRVHPRVRGGEQREGPFFRVVSGASPRVRGGRSWRTRATCFAGCIPAHAGWTCTSRPSALIASVHPRVCGGEPSATGFLSSVRGASPRARGRLGLDDLSGGSLRFIPVRAGVLRSAVVPVNRTDRCIPARAGWTRPLRSRPELDSGASPRVRAGLKRDAVPRRTWRVHPRPCGVTSYRDLDEAMRLGSSPRVRGSRRQVPAVGAVDGFIPACAGDTGSAVRGIGHTAVHPVVRGSTVGFGGGFAPIGAQPSGYAPLWLLFT